MLERRLRAAFGLTLLILGVEVAGGILSHSLALLSDAGHVVTDFFALGLAWFATVQANRPADERKTYGYHRVGILSALVNAATLLVIVAAIGYAAVQRFRHPEPTTPLIMALAASVGILLNLLIALGLKAHAHGNLNARAALLHVLGDVGASVGVIVGAVIILATGWYQADPLISVAIAVLIARGAWRILRETTDILLEASPKGLNTSQMVRDMVRAPGVTDVHDLHVWSIDGSRRALSAHVEVETTDLRVCDDLVRELNRMLEDSYSIAHSTFQFECTSCAPDLYCSMEAPVRGDAHAGHHHEAPGKARQGASRKRRSPRIDG